MRWRTVALVLLLAGSAAFAQDSTLIEQLQQRSERTSLTEPSEQATQPNVYSQQPIEVKPFDQKKWKEIVGDETYSEKDRKRNKSQSGGGVSGSGGNQSSDKQGGKKRFQGQDYEMEDEDESNFNLPINPLLVKIIFYSIAALIVGYILFLIIKNARFKSSPKIIKSDTATEELTDIRELPVDHLLQKALSSGDYKLAVRIYFLALLKKLDEGGLIRWKKDKTNREYLSELFSQEVYFEEVRLLTLAYEQVWYGNHTFSAQAYQQLFLSFQAMDQKLNSTQET
ncbi:MAG TPA: hypothetical protein DGG95_12655 [Cytophagales bacterium]|jgi:hypothetical protein|nr:hypothetical protein [Cytophagales bacterium]